MLPKGLAMPYDGALLTAAIAQALTAIPGALNEARSLLSQKKRDTSTALKRLDDLRGYLKNFAEAGRWMEEAKRLHELLQALDTTLEPIRNEYNKATAYGRFIAQEYQIKEVRQAWNISRTHSLDMLPVFAEQMTYIETQPLVVQDKISGPEWARRFFMIRAELDELFMLYDKGDDKSINALADKFLQLTHHVRYQMHLADERIRKEALEFLTSLSRFAGEL
jgi:soluble cytochrome b562